MSYSAASDVIHGQVSSEPGRPTSLEHVRECERAREGLSLRNCVSHFFEAIVLCPCFQPLCISVLRDQGQLVR